MNLYTRTRLSTLDKQKKVLQEQVVTAHQGPEGLVGLVLLAHPELPNMKPAEVA